MFSATLSGTNLGLFRDSLQGLVELITEGVIEARKGGLYLTATDPTMVTLIDFQLLSKLFDDYKVEGEQKISINIDNLLSILKRAKASDKVLLSLDREANKLTVMLEGTSARKFTVPLIDIEKSDIPEMNLEFPTDLEINSDVFDDGIGDASVVTDSVIIGVGPAGFTMNAKGDMNQAELKLEKGNESLISLNAKEDVKSKYSLDYLKKIMKAAKLCETVKIKFGNDYPIKMVFTQPDKLELSYVLAPRVED